MGRGRRRHNRCRKGRTGVNETPSGPRPRTGPRGALNPGPEVHQETEVGSGLEESTV